jgi:hypothetical protein
MFRMCYAALAAPLVLLAVPALAQEAAPSPPSAAALPPAVTGTIAPRAFELPDPATLTRPVMEFAATPEIEADFEKFFYFHRDETQFAEAYADIRECDALASGANIYMGGDSFMTNYMATQYGLGGAVGGVIGSAIADAIFGSAARRQQRRINLRNCMGFKGYQRYGMAEKLWKEFNFEEGHGRKKEGERDDALELQALVASGPKPAAKELGL